MSQPIGIIRKVELLNLLQALQRVSTRLGANEAYTDALEDIATATGLAGHLVTRPPILVEIPQRLEVDHE